MRIRIARAALIALAVVVASCSDKALLSPPSTTVPQLATLAAALPPLRISEIHYDNVGGDVGESVEISGPAGMNVAGYQVVLYNGNGGLPYNTFTLTGTVPATCGTRGVIVVTFDPPAIQNGASTATSTAEPDGVALVTPAPVSVIEFLSYEGTFTAANGPAVGMVSTDIGVREGTAEPVGNSLKRKGDGTWTPGSPNSFGACNDQDETPAAIVDDVTISPPAATITQGATQQFTAGATDAADQPIAGVSFTWTSADPTFASVTPAGLATGLASGDARIIATAPNGVADTAELHVDAPLPPAGLPATRFSEIHYDNGGADANEAIEIEGPAGTDLTGWSVVLYNGNGGLPYNTTTLSGTIAARCDGRGVVAVRYPTDGIQNGSPDGFALIDAAGQVVEFLSYEGVFTAQDGPARGKTSTDIGVAEATSSPADRSLQRDKTGAWSGPLPANIGGCNDGVGGPPPPPPGSISFSGRTPSDAPLPVGFQDQIFATVRDASGATVTTTVTWTSETPTIATIDGNGVITSRAAGNAILRATAEDGTTATHTLPMSVATASTTAQYAGNAEFGEPADADASDDFIIRRAQFTASYSNVRNTPNWVSYNLEATHFGGEDRCDCFTRDPLLPESFKSYTTADYTGAGAFHGYGIDRGHLARSFDRTSASLDNATTFYFSNIIPQAADLNQGRWAVMETYLGDLARFENKEVYIITGPAGSKGTIKDQENGITIPAKVWKVAVIMPRNQGLANIDDFSDVEVIAVIAPNDPMTRDSNWQMWKTTVDAVEALSGYDLLALLRDDVEADVESGNRKPVAVIDGPYTSSEGSPVSMSAVGTTDPDGDGLTYAWTFGDGGVAAGATVSHTYAQNGSYAVRLIANDSRGRADTVLTTATVSNVAPMFDPATDATILPGDTYTGSGSFTDPGSDTFSATVSYGDGSATAALPLNGKSFSLSHRYTTPGSYTITVSVSDGAATSTQRRTITVLAYDRAIPIMIAQIEELAAANRLPTGFATSFTNMLEMVIRQLGRRPEQTVPLTAQMAAAGRQLDALVRDGSVSTTDAAAVRTMIARVLLMIPRAE